MSILDDIAGSSQHGEKFTRLRPWRRQDPYNPAQTIPTQGDGDKLTFVGVLSQSSSVKINDTIREQTRTSAVITVFDPTVDVSVGDMVRRESTGVKYVVTGNPARDCNAFTGWQPTAEIQVTEYRG